MIKMISDKKIKSELDVVKMNPKTDEVDKLKGGYIVSLDDNKLKFEEHPKLKQTNLELERDQLREKVQDGTLTIEDVGNFITKYL